LYADPLVKGPVVIFTLELPVNVVELKTISELDGINNALVDPLGKLIAVTADPPEAGIVINGTLLIIGLKSK
jgi:hypothetical protein